MAVAPFKPAVGKKWISGTGSAEEFYTRQTRDSMAHIIAQFKRWMKHMDEQSINVLYDALEPTFELSKSIVPVKTRALQNSGYLEKRKFRGGAQVTMGYAKGGIPNYAAIVHERLDYFHAKPGQAKYLEHAILADFTKIQERIKEGFKVASSA